MASVTIRIDTDNAAFDGCEASELARILRDLADSMEYGAHVDRRNLRDINGNVCGSVKVEG